MRIVNKTKNQQEHKEARELFHNKGLSIQELASRFGKTERTIYRWLSEESQEKFIDPHLNTKNHTSRQTHHHHAYKVPIVIKRKTRKITHACIIMYKGKYYRIDYKMAGKTVEVQEINAGKNFLVYLNDVLLKTLDL
ncbi:MAG: hypothetical protein ACTSV5_10905 [Promethearchaeota archaeon]